MEKLNQNERGLLSLAIIFILSGITFDLSDIVIQTNQNQWTEIHCFLKDLQAVGYSLLAFTLCSYSNIKIKTFTFMLILWRMLVVPLNLLDLYYPAIVLPVYAVYIIFLYRIYTLDDWPPVFLNSQNYQYIENTTKSFNVLLPISTFRGLLQILFTRSSPKYETRLLISGNHIYSVQKSRFVKQDYDHKIIQDLMEKAGARIKLLGLFTPDDRLKYDKLLGKRTFTGIRDCRRLEV